MTTRLLKELTIQLHNIRILMGLTHLLPCINPIDGIHSLLDRVRAIAVRLTSSTNTASRACHHLHKLQVLLSCLDVLHQLARVFTMHYSAIHLRSVHIHWEPFDSIQTTGLCYIQLLQRLTSLQFICSTQRSLHHTTTGTKYVSSSRANAHRRIEVHFSEVSPIENTLLLTEITQLLGSKNSIYRRNLLIQPHLLAFNLVLLGSARH